MPTILERVTKVTAARLGAQVDAVKPSSNFTDDLGADSLDQVELIMGLEEEFSTTEKPVKIPDEDAAKIKTVQDAVDYLNNKGITDADTGLQVTKSAPQASKTIGAPPDRSAKIPQETASRKQTTAPGTVKTASRGVKPVAKNKGV